ncbi:hypothetical protein FQN57_001811 [Myotisia sp. PD_48]|nr:hypothetical protein FQN57_001811 [Myotisia sp. PD_48]
MDIHRRIERGRSVGLLSDQPAWYWKLSVTASSWLLLIGFILFSLSLESDKSQFKSDKPALIGTSIIMLTAAYLLSALYYVRWRNTNYLFHSCFFPCFSSCVLGLFNLVLNLLIRELPINNSAIAIISVATVSSVVYGFASLYFSFYWMPCVRIEWRKARPKHLPTRANSVELQRQQFARLYVGGNEDRAPSPRSSTFQIALPESTIRDDETIVTTPSYERRTPPTQPHHYSPLSMHGHRDRNSGHLAELRS